MQRQLSRRGFYFLRGRLCNSQDFIILEHVFQIYTISIRKLPLMWPLFSNAALIERKKYYG